MTTAGLGSVPDYVSWFVNRSKQHQRFREMLAGDTPMAVMLIEAPTAMGKSFLVKKMGYLTEQAGQPLVAVDFRDRRAHDTLWLARFSRDSLARHVEPALFNDLTRTINEVTAGLEAAPGRRPVVQQLMLDLEDGRRTVEIDLIEIRQNLNRFNESEVRTLAFDLGLKFDDLVGANLAARIVDLLATCERYQLLDQLLLASARELPHLVWWRVVEVVAATASPPLSPAGEGPVEDNWGELRGSSLQTRELAFEQINRAFYLCLRQVLDRHRLVFLFDSYEEATVEAEAWIQKNLLFPLYDGRLNNLLIVIAGRRAPDAGDRRPLVGKTGLDPFTIDHVREYLLEKRNIQEDDIEKVYNYCRGYPGILATMADAYTSVARDDDDW